VQFNGDQTKPPHPVTANGNGIASRLADSGKKRAISEVEEVEHQAKRSKVAPNDTIVLDDSTDGAIFIDDD
jgi:hypothetical protein